MSLFISFHYPFLNLTELCLQFLSVYQCYELTLSSVLRTNTVIIAVYKCSFSTFYCLCFVLFYFGSIVPDFFEKLFNKLTYQHLTTELPCPFFFYKNYSINNCMLKYSNICLFSLPFYKAFVK